jgi:hypothetical protein
MTKKEALAARDRLVARRVPGFAADRTSFTAWLLQAQSLFGRVLPPSDLTLQHFRSAVAEYLGDSPDKQKARQSAIGAFEACCGLMDDMPEADFVSRQPVAPPAQPADAPGNASRPDAAGAIRLFISHSSADAKLAELVVKLLRSALGLAPREIRCTSVDGYRLPAGADTDDQIRREVYEATVLLGIISTESMDSLYVAFELGARWGAGKTTIPLMVPGLSPSTIKGPLGGKNALRSDTPGQLQQLVGDVAGQLGVEPNPPESYQSELEAILEFGKESAKARAVPTPVVRPHEGPPPLPTGFALMYGVDWDVRGFQSVPYCHGCRTGSGKWVALSVFEQGAPPYLVVRTLTCPHGHPRIVLGAAQQPPLTSFQRDLLAKKASPPPRKS